jgi:hypothetical protein
LTGATAEIQASNLRLAAGAVSSLDWHNTRAALLLSLDKRLREAGSDKERQDLLASVAQAIQTEQR